MKFNSKNSFKSLDNISSSGKEYKIFNLKKAEKNGLEGISKLTKISESFIRKFTKI